MQGFQDIFISYGRRDSLGLASRINRRLVDLGFTVWFDYDDIPLGVDYQKQIDDGIERSDNILFLISPHSINSPYCGLELDLAIKHQKRIIPWLHVEQISYETWQERNPLGTLADWQDYQAKGLHDHFQNMPPILRKINWIYGRDHQDDFEKAVAGLLEIYDRHKAYVHQHTQLLIQALDWERHQKRSSSLLIGEERLNAEQWLKVRFTDSQPPCLPTPLQCEFITESRKNAENLMTEVFLAYADEDRSTAETIRHSLQREGFTVWINTTDIRAGSEFQHAIDRGIEEADNLIYLLSEASVRSPWCQHELEYGLSLHKRIIPILVEALPPDQIPVKLQNLQHINLTDNVQESDYTQDECQLLQVLRQDAPYHETHKLLLTKALKWDRQHHNPTLLLRGYNLQQSEVWLKLAQQKPAYPALPLQDTYIQESLRQPPGLSLDVFISYSRANSGFARQLNDALQLQGKRTWFDQESIAAGTADFQQEIHRGIESSDIFLFILSPRSVTSPYCADEVEYAASLNKRVITILYYQINPPDLHPELAKVQWLDFNRYDGDFGQNFNELIRAIDTDREHVHSHTKWLQRAIEWEQKEHSPDLLLRGNEFAIAQNWLEISQIEQKKPAPTALQTLFITKSKEEIDARTRKEKRQKSVLRSLLGVMTGVAILAVVASILAIKNQRKAAQNEVKSLVALSEAKLAVNNELESLLLGLKAAQFIEANPDIVNHKDLKNAVTNTLRQGLYAITEKNRFQHKGFVNTVIFSPDGTMLATIDTESVKIWKIDGTLLAKLDEKDYSQLSIELMFSADSQTLVTISSSDDSFIVKFWDTTGKELSQLENGKKFKEAFLSGPDAPYPTIQTFDGEKVQIWDMDGKKIFSTNGQKTGETIENIYLTVSRNGERFSGLVRDDEGNQIIKTWQRDSELLYEFSLAEEESWFWYFNYRDFVLIQSNEEGSIFQLKNYHGEIIATFDINKENELTKTHTFEGLTIDKQEKLIAFEYYDKTNDGDEKPVIQLRNLDGQLIKSFSPHDDDVNLIEFSPDSQSLITTHNSDKTIKLWDLTGNELVTLRGHKDWITDVMFSPNMEQLASASYDGQVKLWEISAFSTSKTLSTSSPFSTSLNADSSQFSEAGDRLITSVINGAIQLRPMDMENVNKETEIRTLVNKNQGNPSLSFSQDGSMVLASLNDSNGSESNQFYGSVQLWLDDNKTPITLINKVESEEADQPDVMAWISPDSQTIMTHVLGVNFYGPLQLWNRQGDLIQTLIERQVHDDIGQDPQNVLETFWFNSSKRIITGETVANFGVLIKLWDSDGKLISTLTERIDSNLPEQYVQDFMIKFGEDSDRLLTALVTNNEFGPLKLRDQDGTPITTILEKIDISENSPYSQPQVMMNNQGDRLVTLLQKEVNDEIETKVQLWDRDGNPIKTLIVTTQAYKVMTALRELA